ncbi:hypothetical protein SELMODRAFT_417689 [Selaginella moellendorffii]|uniref:Uncharacterized protein n=1 Tax=Selaginella moellendorffii TaxID=88036 RepID=D8S399_SELML|nr:hypothetical protein SELMODRAFT_417689 [Selaginella moellendorffii]
MRCKLTSLTRRAILSISAITLELQLPTTSFPPSHLTGIDHNSNPHAAGLNKFSDMDMKEFTSIYCGCKSPTRPWHGAGDKHMLPVLPVEEIGKEFSKWLKSLEHDYFKGQECFQEESMHIATGELLDKDKLSQAQKDYGGGIKGMQLLHHRAMAFQISFFVLISDFA